MEPIDHFAADVEASGEDKKHEAKQLMFVLSAEQRMDVMSGYCRYCGCDNPDCSCWNDE